MMTTWAVIPVKHLRESKRRLAHLLTPDERADLILSFLDNMLATLNETLGIDRTLVVTGDPVVSTLAGKYGAELLIEFEPAGLNAAVSIGVTRATAQGASAVLILPADLPLISREDVLTLIDHAADPPVVVIAPDRHNTGTNALLISPAGLIEYDFGENSFQRHCQRVEATGARLEIVNIPTLGLDLDLPEDLELVRKLELPKVGS